MHSALKERKRKGENFARKNSKKDRNLGISNRREERKKKQLI